MLPTLTIPSFRQGKIFPGLYEYEQFDKSGTVIFDRSVDIAAIESALSNNGSSKIIAVTGPSGVGKSVILEMLCGYLSSRDSRYQQIINVQFGLGTKYAHERLCDALEIIDRLESNTTSQDNTTNSEYILVTLDQFELFIDRVNAIIREHKYGDISLNDFMNVIKNDRSTVLGAFAELLARKQNNPELHVIVAVRDDRYFDLRLLGKMGQIPCNAIEIRGIIGDSAETILNVGLDGLHIPASAKISIINDLKEEDGRILPVKAQLVGRVLEMITFEENPLRRFFRRMPPHSDRTSVGQNIPRKIITNRKYESYGRAKGLIRLYFYWLMKSTGKPRATAEVLYILSLEGRVKSSYTIPELAALTYRTDSEVELILCRLLEYRIVREWDGAFALRHDFIAASFGMLSGRLIRPAIRDNLTYSYTAHTAGLFTDIDGAINRDITTNRRRILVYSFEFLMIVFFMYRFFNYKVFLDTSESLLASVPVISQFIVSGFRYMPPESWTVDWSYIPIFIAQFLWAIYVAELINKIYLRIDKGLSAHSLSLFMLIVVLVGMIWTAFSPGLWLFWIGISGFAVGLKFLVIGYKIRRHADKHNRFWIVGIYTLVNCSFLIWIGYVWIPRIEWDLMELGILFETNISQIIGSFVTLSPITDYLWNYYAFIPLIVYFLYMYNAHVNRDSAVEFIGLHGRISTGLNFK